MRLRAAIVVALLAGACGSDEGTATYTADDRTIDVGSGDEFVIDLPDDPDDGKQWALLIGSDRLDAVVDLVTDHHAVRQAEPSPDGVEVFLELDVTPGQRATVEDVLRAEPTVRDIRFIDQDEQYERFREFARDLPEYLENITADDLPTSLLVTLTDSCAQRIDDEEVDGRRRFGFRAEGRCSTDIEARYGEVLAPGDEPLTFEVRPAEEA